MGKYIIYNPDTTPVTTKYLNGVEIESITNETLYGYQSIDGEAIVPQPEPSEYILVYNEQIGDSELVDIHSYVDFEHNVTQQWLSDYDFTLPDFVEASAYTINYSPYEYYVRMVNNGDYSNRQTIAFESPNEYATVHVANQNAALYTGTYNLSDGTSVDIVGVYPDGYMYDEERNEYQVTMVGRYNYFYLPGTPTKYFLQKKTHGNTEYETDPEEYIPECIKLQNGKYQVEEYFVLPHETGMYVSFRYDGNFEQFFAKEITDGNITVQVTDSAGTPTSVTVSTVFVYVDSNGDEIYGAYKKNSNKGIFYTGTSMGNLVWYGGSDSIEIRFFDYNILTVGGFPSVRAVSEPVPAVAYTPNNGIVYYNRTRIPVFNTDRNEFVYSLGKTATFNYSNCVYLYSLYDVECGGFNNLTPNIVDRLLIDGVDRTNDYKNGVIDFINPYRLQYRDENWNWYNSTEMKITFTDEFFNTGTLNIYEETCSH